MRRAAPFLIVIIGLFALVVDFWPGLTLPFGGQAGTGRPIETKLGLDLQGGLSVEYQATCVNDPSTNTLKCPGPSDMAVVRTIMENRVNSTGVAEPLVVTQGTDRVVVEMPGVQNVDAVRSLVGSTGRLDFVPLPSATYGTSSAPGPQQAVQGQPLPTQERPLFSGDQVQTATIGTDQFGSRAVDFTLKGDGARLFGTYTSQHIGEFFAILLDNKVVTAPSINGAITGGSGQITNTGGLPLAEATTLVTDLKYGALPFPVSEVQNQVIAPTLGVQFLHQSLVAAIIGIGLVLLFMVLHYRLPGLIADGALLYYALVVLAIFRLVPVTLTLAGIAGFVLSVGMAVDANILIFERTKEELRLGKPLPSAIEAGFNRAWNSILDSNVSSLITAGILYWFGSSTIRGFALVLIIGVLISMYTAITVTRTVLRLVVRQEWARRAWLFGVSDEEFVARQVARPGRGEARARV
jgi:preprotein translocase subunit SecD